MNQKASPEQTAGQSDLARFLRDWVALWREELQAQANDPEGMKLAPMAEALWAGMRKSGTDFPASLEPWRALTAVWADTMGTAKPKGRSSPGDWADTFATLTRGLASGDRASAGTQTAAAASGVGDAEVERLARRVDELEARLAKLEASPRLDVSSRLDASKRAGHSRDHS